MSGAAPARRQAHHATYTRTTTKGVAGGPKHSSASHRDGPGDGFAGYTMSVSRTNTHTHTHKRMRLWSHDGYGTRQRTTTLRC